MALVLGVSTASADLLGGSGGGAVGGVITTVTGTVGGVVGTVTGTFENVLDSPPSSGGSSLPDDSVNTLVETLLGGGDTSSTGTQSGSDPGSGSVGTTSGGSPTGQPPAADTTAPTLGFRLVSRLKQAARTGRLRVRIRASEAAIVGFNAQLRPGKARRVGKRALKVSHKLVKTRATMLVFRRAGSLTVALKLPKKSRRSLANARNARVALRAWATDLSRNQARKNVKRTLKR